MELKHSLGMLYSAAFPLHCEGVPLARLVGRPCGFLERATAPSPLHDTAPWAKPTISPPARLNARARTARIGFPELGDTVDALLTISRSRWQRECWSAHLSTNHPPCGAPSPVAGRLRAHFSSRLALAPPTPSTLTNRPLSPA